MKRLRAAAAAAVVLGAAGVGAAWALDPARTDTLARGVSIAGVDVGELRVEEAARRVESRVVPRFRRPIVVRAGTRTYRLSADDVQLRVDVDGAVRRALTAGHVDPLPLRSWRRIRGGAVDVDIPLGPTFSREGITRLLGRMHAEIDRSPRDASVTPRASGLEIQPARSGRRVDTAGFTARISRALRDPRLPGTLTASVARVAPRVTEGRLAERFPAYIVVDRKRFALRLYRDLEHVRTYRIAVGKLGLETPAGLYHIQSKQIDPTWYVPSSAWAGDLAGKVVPPGPKNPLKARWMGFDGATGIHGTDDVESLGTAASHGCIRMAIPDVKEVYGQVPQRAPVYIA